MWNGLRTRAWAISPYISFKIFLVSEKVCFLIFCSLVWQSGSGGVDYTNLLKRKAYDGFVLALQRSPAE